MQLNPSEISELIKSRIQGLEASADVRNQGTVISVTDGIVRIHGLSDVMKGDILGRRRRQDDEPHSRSAGRSRADWPRRGCTWQPDRR
jgi:F-type H+-transporting ATPase subunit alpha